MPHQVAPLALCGDIGDQVAARREAHRLGEDGVASRAPGGGGGQVVALEGRPVGGDLDGDMGRAARTGEDLRAGLYRCASRKSL
ncbi:MAG: hypothetical protein WCI67_19885, partial [Chloroflexales bacterium]